MSDDTITQLPDPSRFGSDPFTDVLRDGARKPIEQAIHAELAALMAACSGEKLDDGRARLVRHGHLPEREVMTGIGPVPVKVPRVRDRKPGADRITFTPSILPRYLRKAKSVEELLPWLYLKGVSTGDFTEALEALLGPNAKGLSAKTVSVAFNFFVEAYGVKWDKAVAKLVKDRDALLTFYDYPGEHWKHIRTSNPIESTFATVRHRTKRTKGSLSRKTGLAMACKLMMSAQKKWRKLDGQNRLPEIIQGIEFRDGLRHLQTAA